LRFTFAPRVAAVAAAAGLRLRRDTTRLDLDRQVRAANTGRTWSRWP